MSWAAGYNNSVAYTTGYYQEQSPTWLKAALAMQRVAPPPTASSPTANSVSARA